MRVDLSGLGMVMAMLAGRSALVLGMVCLGVVVLCMVVLCMVVPGVVVLCRVVPGVVGFAVVVRRMVVPGMLLAVLHGRRRLLAVIVVVRLPDTAVAHRQAQEPLGPHQRHRGTLGRGVGDRAHKKRLQLGSDPDHQIGAGDARRIRGAEGKAVRRLRRVEHQLRRADPFHHTGDEAVHRLDAGDDGGRGLCATAGKGGQKGGGCDVTDGAHGNSPGHSLVKS